MNEKRSRVSNLGERRQSLVAAGVRSAIMQDQPQMGGNQGDYTRPPCGTCLSWRRLAQAGKGGMPLNMGMCMFGPPIAHPVMNEAGQVIAQSNARPVIPSEMEGCDQHDDGTDDDGDGSEVPAAGKILATG